MRIAKVITMNTTIGYQIRNPKWELQVVDLPTAREASEFAARARAEGREVLRLGNHVETARRI